MRGRDAEGRDPDDLEEEGREAEGRDPDELEEEGREAVGRELEELDEGRDARGAEEREGEGLEA